MLSKNKNKQIKTYSYLPKEKKLKERPIHVVIYLKKTSRAFFLQFRVCLCNTLKIKIKNLVLLVSHV